MLQGMKTLMLSSTSTEIHQPSKKEIKNYHQGAFHLAYSRCILHPLIMTHCDENECQ
jgi:hypothetical protein